MHFAHWFYRIAYATYVHSMVYGSLAGDCLPVCLSVIRPQGGVLSIRLNVSTRYQQKTEMGTVEGCKEGLCPPLSFCLIEKNGALFGIFCSDFNLYTQQSAVPAATIINATSRPIGPLSHHWTYHQCV